MKRYLLGLAFSVMANLVAANPIAYIASEGDYWQVWLINEDGSNAKQLTDSKYDKNTLSWYPNGKSLLINGNQGELVKLDLETLIEHKIELDNPLNGYGDAVLSPSGKWIVFSISTSESRDDNNIWIVSIDGKQRKKLTNLKGMQHEPQWSLDSQYVYFLSGEGDGHHDIWRVDVNSKATERITAAKRFHFDISVNDKGKLLYANNSSGSYELWMQDMNKAPKQLTFNKMFNASPVWGVGSKIYYESSSQGVSNIWSLDYLSQEETNVQLTSHEFGARKPVVYIETGVRRKLSKP